MKHEINVTWGHIHRGAQCKAQFCPIALAIQDAIPGSKVEVLGAVAILDGTALHLPIECWKFVDRFDNSGTAPPFSFFLDTERFAEGWKWC